MRLVDEYVSARPDAIDATRAAGQAMRILMISDVYFPRVNGVSTSIATFRASLAAMGHRVDLLAPDYGHATGNEDGIRRISARGVPLDPEDRMIRYGKLLNAVRGRGGLYDLIHIQTPFVAHYAGTRLARRWRVPLVASYHTYFEEYLYNYVPIMPKAATRFVARSFSRNQCNAVDAVVVPSTAMLTALRHYGVRTRAMVLPTGIELDAFRSGEGAAFRLRHGIDPLRPVMLFVGRVAHEKNIGFLIDVVARLRLLVPDVLLLITGEGPALSPLRRQVRKARLDSHVRFIGYLSRQQALQDCYRAGDVFTFASRTETQGLVLLEAMACGVPVVSTAVMGTLDVLNGARGAIIAPQEPEAFAQRVALLLRDARLRMRMATAAKRDAACWSANVMAGRLAALYAELLPDRDRVTTRAAEVG